MANKKTFPESAERVLAHSVKVLLFHLSAELCAEPLNLNGGAQLVLTRREHPILKFGCKLLPVYRYSSHILPYFWGFVKGFSDFFWCFLSYANFQNRCSRAIDSCTYNSYSHYNQKRLWKYIDADKNNCRASQIFCRSGNFDIYHLHENIDLI